MNAQIKTVITKFIVAVSFETDFEKLFILISIQKTAFVIRI